MKIEFSLKKRCWNIRKAPWGVSCSFLCKYCLVTTDYVDFLNHPDEFETEKSVSKKKKVIIILTSFSMFCYHVLICFWQLLKITRVYVIEVLFGSLSLDATIMSCVFIVFGLGVFYWSAEVRWSCSSPSAGYQWNCK